MKRFATILTLGALAILVGACSGASAGEPAASGPAVDASVVVSARDIKFEQAELAAPANVAFALRFDNHDSAPHNVSIYTDSSAGTAAFKGEIFGGDGSRTYQVPALAAGSYYFRCDVHPDMHGTIVAK
ncbi:MAG TPA: cupredoxin domain-containing protein [Candidatus Limnocylindrales bacterium]